MSYKGRLNLDCIASDPTSSVLYGIANARGKDDEYTVLVKSNTNPSNPGNIDWSIVSKVKISKTGYRYPLINTVVCAVSSGGEFSAFYYDPSYTTVAGPALVPIGVQFDPKKEAEAGAGSGWSDIIGSRTKLAWTHRYLVPKAFYVRDASSGAESAVLLLTDDFASVIRFGVVDEATNTLQLAGVWKEKPDGTYEKGELTELFEKNNGLLQPRILPSLGNIGSRRIAYGDGHLYFTRVIYNLAEVANNTRNVSATNQTLTVYPFTKATDDPVSGVMPSPMPGNAFYGEYLFYGVRRDAAGTGGGDVPYLGRAGYVNDVKGRYTTIIENPGTYSNSTTQKPPTVFLPPLNITTGDALHNGTHYRLSSIQSIGGHLPGQFPFAVIPMTDGLYAVSLYGDAPGGGVGTLTGPMEVSVMAEETINTWPRKDNPLLAKSPNMKDDSSMVGVYVGVVVAVVALGAGIFLWRRNRRVKKSWRGN
ncbi:MAG: hypothetical protein J3R72DRAFT_150187 [Linnemannia gamsii]|nr:MAG: hypothetical protein J3R72DRAFT_150187 [Linnemannia gamsii]